MKVVKQIKEKLNLKQKEQQEEVEKIESIRCEEKIKKEQTEELNSEQFKKISDIVKKYNQRKNLDKEKELFNIIRSLNEEYESELASDYQYKKYTQKIKFKIISNFISSLTDEELNTNIYLKTAYLLIESSKKDCQDMINKLIGKIKSDIMWNGEQSKRINKIYQIKIPIELDSLKIFLKKIRTSKYICYRPLNDSKELKIIYIDVLDEDNIKIYQKYNEIVHNIHLLTAYIYRLRNEELLSIYEEYESNQLVVSNHFGEILVKQIIIDTNTNDFNNDSYIYANFSVNLQNIDKLNENETSSTDLIDHNKQKVLKRKNNNTKINIWFN